MNKTKSPLTKRILFILIFILALAVLISYAIFGRQQEFMPEVEGYEVSPATIDKEVSANGVIDAESKETLVAQLSGEIIKVVVKKGDWVKPGSLIAIIDPEQTLNRQKELLAALETTRRAVRSELLSLRTAYTQAKAEAEQAERDYRNLKQLFELGSASEEQLSRALDRKNYTASNLIAVRQRLNFREGRPLDDPRQHNATSDDEIIANSPEVIQLLAQLASINSNLKRTEIRAGIAGLVIELPAEAGMLVTPGFKVAVIANPKQLKITSNIDEVDIGYIQIGQEVRIESDVFLNTTLTGRVSSISPAIQRIGEARVCEITISLTDPENRAKIGASCSIYINVLHKTDVLAIPLEVFILEEKKRYVFVLKPLPEPNICLIEKRQIQTGVLGLDKIEVLSGLSQGEKIARGNLKLLQDGKRVRLARSTTPLNRGER